MKTTKLSLGLMAMVGISLGLASCSNEETMTGVSEGTAMLTVTLSKEMPYEADTRTALEEVNGDLDCVWTANDRVLVTDATGAKKGILSIIGEGGESTAQFSGMLTGVNDGNQTLSFYYLGKNVTNPAGVSNPHVFSVASPDGTVESLSDNDILSSTTTVCVADGLGYTEDMGLTRKVAFAHFELIFPESVNYNNETVTISGTNVKNSGSLSLIDNAVTGIDGTISVAKKDFYMTIVPAEGMVMEFKTQVGDLYFKGTLTPRTFVAGEFVRKAHGEGIPVTMIETEPEPENPGDISNWGGEVAYPTIKTFPVQKIGLSKDAWTHNWYTDVDVDYGFAAPVEYDYNAISNNHLTSGSYGDGKEAKYFQWGRWLGFPMNVVYAQVNGGFGFGMQERNIKYPRGIGEYSHPSLYYCWDMDSRPCYAYCTDTNWGKQQAINSSIIFGVNANDYLSSNENCKWEDRSGNPCPSGYRVPTMDELDILAPSEESFNGSYAEVKTVNGQNFAMKWTVSATSVYVQSIATNKSSVSVNDPIFNDAPGITLEANGMLYADYPNSISDSPSAKFATSFDGGWKTGGYWSCDSYEWADGGYGAVALMIRIKNGNCKMGLEVVERTAGLCIIPFKDRKAKATSIKPWFPIGC